MRTAAMPEVTVVIPLHDGERFLREALESVARQSFPVAEVVVVDDGSRDGGAEIAETFGARVIRQQNLGVSAARNVGVRAARTEWITYLDQDDVWDPDKNALACEAIARTGRAALAFTDSWRFAGSTTTRASFIGGVAQEHYARVVREPVTAAASACAHATFVRSFARGLFFFPSTLMMQKGLAVEAGLFDEGLHYWGDYEFLLRALRSEQGPVVVVERAVVGHRDHDANASLRHVELLVDPILVADRVLDCPERYAPGAVEVVREQLPAHLRAAGKQLLHDGDASRGYSYLMRALRYQPSLRTAVLAVIARLLALGGPDAHRFARSIWDARADP